VPLKHEDIEAAAIEGAVQRLRPKLMTVTAVLASLLPILWESGTGSDVMKPIAALGEPCDLTPFRQKRTSFAAEGFRIATTV